MAAVAVAETDDRDCPLVCPIEQDGHMKEPVTLPCGCNFERRAITASSSWSATASWTSSTANPFHERRGKCVSDAVFGTKSV